MKTALLIISLCCLPTPCFGVGVAGLVAWGLLSLLFRAADGGIEEMASEIQAGNQSAGGCWWWVVAAFVVVGGLAVLLSFFSVAAELRGVTL